MKKFLIYFPKSISGLFLSILGYLNFILSNILLLDFKHELSVIILGTSKIKQSYYMTIHELGFLFGFFVYLFEFILWIIIFKKEYEKYAIIENPQKNSSSIKNSFIYLGLILYLLEFIFSILIQILYIIRGF